jgi:hypothetical protein
VFGEKGILFKDAASTRLGMVMILQQINSVAIQTELNLSPSRQPSHKIFNNDGGERFS